MRKYDTTLIIDGSLSVQDREAIIERYKNTLEKLGGTVERLVRWGQRTLAYPISKKQQGYYVIFYHSSEPAIIKSFEHEMRLNESILRYMTIVFDGKHPDYLHEDTARYETPSSVSTTKEKTGETFSAVEDTVEEGLDEVVLGDENSFDESRNDIQDKEAVEDTVEEELDEVVLGDESSFDESRNDIQDKEAVEETDKDFTGEDESPSDDEKEK